MLGLGATPCFHEKGGLCQVVFLPPSRFPVAGPKTVAHASIRTPRRRRGHTQVEVRAVRGLRRGGPVSRLFPPSPTSKPKSSIWARCGGDPTKVFAVHRGDEKLRDSPFSFLRAVSLEPIEGEETLLATGKSSRYIGGILNCMFSTAQAVVVEMKPDEEATVTTTSTTLAPNETVEDLAGRDRGS